MGARLECGGGGEGEGRNDVRGGLVEVLERGPEVGKNRRRGRREGRSVLQPDSQERGAVGAGNGRGRSQMQRGTSGEVRGGIAGREEDDESALTCHPEPQQVLDGEDNHRYELKGLKAPLVLVSITLAATGGEQGRQAGRGM